MQKTGCTHIASLLSNLFDGEIIGKHNAATPGQIRSNRYFISSIRNPWDWYLSLWTFGVQGDGALILRLTKEKDLVGSFKSAIRSPRRNFSSFYHELLRGVTEWRSVYDRNDNIESFRKWMKLMQDELNAGAWKVIGEARESGNVGLFRSSGEVRSGLVEEILTKIPFEKILWEAPQKAQQVWFIKLLGSNVNLGNIGPQEVIPLETIRIGMRGDTFSHFLNQKDT